MEPSILGTTNAHNTNTPTTISGSANVRRSRPSSRYSTGGRPLATAGSSVGSGVLTGTPLAVSTTAPAHRLTTHSSTAPDPTVAALKPDAQIAPASAVAGMCHCDTKK